MEESKMKPNVLRLMDIAVQKPVPNYSSGVAQDQTAFVLSAVDKTRATFQKLWSSFLPPELMVSLRNALKKDMSERQSRSREVSFQNGQLPR